MLKLKESSILWAIQSIQKHYDTYVFPYPFEYEAINIYQKEVIEYLKTLDVFGNGIRPYRTALTPKSIYGFRIATQLDPLDSIITNAIIYEKHKLLEQKRIPKNENIVFSFRLSPKPDGTIYDPNYNYSTYLKEANKIVNSKKYSHIVITDISDFYPSIYLHNIETALFDLESGSAHFLTLINHLKAMYLNQTHKGLPVGPQFSRPLSELILHPVDLQLKEANIKYIRYVDDYIIFCNSENDAYNNLSYLAQILYNTTNLKLNEHKTNIFDIESFSENVLKRPEDITKQKIIIDFKKLLEELDIDADPYDDINLDDLSEEDRKKIEEVNLENVLVEELTKDKPDFGLIAFILNNLAKIDNTNIANLILREDNLRKIFPRIRSVILYLERVRSFSYRQKIHIGKLIVSLTKGFIGNLEFNRMWLLYLFTRHNEWNNAKEFNEMIIKYKDPSSLRELYMAVGRSNNINFFRNNKSIKLDQDSWVRRAFIAGISCLPKSERAPWYKSRELTNRDFLDKIIERWAKEHPFERKEDPSERNEE